MYEEELPNYKFENLIGRGAETKVYLATKKDTGEKHAIKIIEKHYLKDNKIKRYLNNEVYILKSLSHPNIVKYHGVKIGKNYIFLIFEFCNGGTLESCLKNYQNRHNKPFSQEIVQYLMRKIISAFMYLHSCNIIHRDIKLENILLVFNNEEDLKNLNMLKSEVKVIDFGYSRILKKEELATSVLGNRINMEPHILKKLEKIENDPNFGYDKSADIWSLGTITYELLIGCPAFDARNAEELVQKIEKGNYKIPHHILLSKEAISFLNGMIRYDEKSRLTIEELSKQQFLTKDVSKFHNIELNKVNGNIDLRESVFINIKDEKNNINNIWNMYEGAFKISSMEPCDTKDNKQFYEPKNIVNINDTVPDIIGNEIIINDKYDNGKDENKIENVKINKNLDKFLQNCFEEMNNDCLYIEPLLIPIQPSNYFNSADPIGKFMEEL